MYFAVLLQNSARNTATITDPDGNGNRDAGADRNTGADSNAGADRS